MGHKTEETKITMVGNRYSIRLKGYDYSRKGACFITICTKNRECLFGKIIEQTMYLNDGGQMVQAIWDDLPLNYPGIEIDAFVIMPNHIHGIIINNGRRGEPCVRPLPCVRPCRSGQIEMHKIGETNQ